MKNFIKLLNFEINRFVKLYVIMLVVIFIVQLGTIVLQAFSYMGIVKDITRGGHVSPEQFLHDYWAYNIADSVYSLVFLAPIAFGVLGLMFYLFFIWYRDWFARNSFIYRLLMLPTNRMNIFYAKLTTIMLTVLGMVASQLVFLAIYKEVVKFIVPVVYRIDMPISKITSSSEYLFIIAPDSISNFIISYGLGLTFVIVIFTSILFERSFHLIGIFIGIMYTLLAFLLFVFPFIVQIFMVNHFYLYTDEMLYLSIAIVVGIIVTSLLVSRYLITKKITV